MFDHCIENRQQFAHASNQGDLGCFTRITQSFVEDPDDRITSAGHQSRHVEHSPDGGTATPDPSPTSESPTVAVEWCDSHQRRDLFAVEPSKFRQLRQKGTTDHRADTGNAAQEIFVFLPDRALTDGLVEIFVGSFQLCFQPTQMGLDPFSDCPGSCAQPVSLGHHHLDELASTGNECTQFQADLIGQGAQRRTHGLGKASQHFGIDAVGLGQLPGGFGEVSDLPRVDHDDRELSTAQSAGDTTLQSAGGLQHDQSGAQLVQR